mmetsp:Transcript_24939/g.59337  ORF Transcript_24939/g.59337 Transcript_24939/m.59337 type:complete len:381 (+) Transcript_24939:79-1221(+)
MNSARNCTKLYDKIAGNAGSPAKRQGLARLSHKPSQRFRVTCSAGEGPSSSSLSVLVRRKHTEVAETLEELGIEAVEERMQSAVASPSQPPFRVAQAISAPRLQGMPAVIVELARAPGQNTEGLLETARMLEKSGAEAIVLRTDGDDTPSGLLDLFEVCRSVRVPVLRKELVLHPIQVVESKEAGAAGVVGVITSVTGNGTPTLARFAAAIGEDAPGPRLSRAHPRPQPGGCCRIPSGPKAGVSLSAPVILYGPCIPHTLRLCLFGAKSMVVPPTLIPFLCPCCPTRIFCSSPPPLFSSCCTLERAKFFSSPRVGNICAKFRPFLRKDILHFLPEPGRPFEHRNLGADVTNSLRVAFGHSPCRGLIVFRPWKCLSKLSPL